MENNLYNILKTPLKILNLLGRHPDTKPLISTLSAIFYLATMYYLLIITLLQYWNINGDIYKFANNLEGVSAYIQTSCKTVFTIIYKDQFRELLTDLNKFWSIEKCFGSYKEDLKNILQKSSFILNAFFICVIVTEGLIVLGPIFTKDLAVGAWTMENQSLLFKFTLALQECFLLFIFTTFTFILDCTFLGLFIYVIVQFKILNFCLSELNVSKAMNKIEKQVYWALLKENIEHHKFLLNYSEKLKRTASPVMLIEFITTSMLFCTEMYMFFESTGLQESIRRGVGFSAVLFQLSFYCIPADYITHEGLAVSDAIFQSDWTSVNNQNIRKMLHIVMLRAQQPITFSGGKVVKINGTTLLNVVKISWSLCTLLRRLKARE